jgi:hypothetical protein
MARMDVRRGLGFVALTMALAMAGPTAGAVGSTSATAEHSMRQFLAQGDEPHAYRATRRLEARHRLAVGWIEASTEFSPSSGFRYAITAEGGSERLRDSVLRKILEGEREAVARGELARAALAPCNYEFQPAGIEGGLAAVLLSPKREERALVDGTMFLRPVDGELVRVEGRLARSPSFWVTRVDIVRTYDRIGGVVVPVALDTTARLRFFGTGTLRITYDYAEIDGRPVAPLQLTRRR